MPSPAEHPETNRYYAAQAGLGALTSRLVSGLWVNLDPTRLRASFERLRPGAAAIGARNSQAAVSLATDYYEEFRTSITGSTRFRAPVIDAPGIADIEARIDELAAELLASLDTVVDELYLAEVATGLQNQIEGTVQASVADAGIGEIFAALLEDPEAKGWARITRPGACSFCRLLASRGPVYFDQHSASFRAHVPINGRGGTCQCVAEPWIGNSYEPTAQVRADTVVYDQVAADGFVGADARNEFRRRLEGRADGPRRPRPSGRRRTKTPVEVQGQRLGFDYLTPSQLQHQLAVVEGLRESEYRTRQIARIKSRLLALGA